MKLEADDFILEDEAPGAVFAQTASLGAKQSAIRWLPGTDGLCVAGTWDDGAENELAVWAVQLEGVDAMELAAGEAEPPPPTRRLAAKAHGGGCVLDLAVSGGGGGATQLVAYSACGAGGVCAHRVELAADGGAELVSLWSAPGGGLATLGVCWSAEAGALVAAGEDGGLTTLSEAGAPVWRAQSREPALFAACWWDAHTAVSAGTSLALWDVRAAGGAPVRLLSPSPGAPAQLAAQLLSVAAEPMPPNLLAAGGSDGAVHLWDVRAAASASARGGAAAAALGLPPLRSVAAHTADVWGLQFAGGARGQLLSCSSDGTLQAWQLDGGSDADVAMSPGAGAGDSRTLVELPLPINSLHLSAEHGMLASASDAEVLTFLDLRS